MLNQKNELKSGNRMILYQKKLSQKDSFFYFKGFL